MRVKHEKYGLGVTLEEFISTGGLPVARVVFDSCPQTERIILATCLKESDAPLPAVAKTAKKRKPRVNKEKLEQVNDALLVEAAPTDILPKLDPLPDDSADYDDPSKFEATGGSESSEAV